MRLRRHGEIQIAMGLKEEGPAKSRRITPRQDLNSLAMAGAVERAAISGLRKEGHVAGDKINATGSLQAYLISNQKILLSHYIY